MNINFYLRPIPGVNDEMRHFLVGQLFSRRRCVAQVQVDPYSVYGCGWIMEVYTEPKFRSLGYATLLVSCLLQRYINAYKEWRLHVLPFDMNTSAKVPLNAEQLIKFYSKFGFEVDTEASTNSGRTIMSLPKCKLQHIHFKHRFTPLDEEFFS